MAFYLIFSSQNVSPMLIKINKWKKQKQKKNKLICSLTEENLANKRCIGHQQGINVWKSRFWGWGMKTGCLQFLRNISIYIKEIELLFTQMWINNIPIKHFYRLTSFRVIRNWKWVSFFLGHSVLSQHTIWTSAWDFQQYGMCDQQSLRSACAYAQSDQSLC